MRYLNFVRLLLVLAFRWSCSAVKQGRLQVTNLTCEYLSNPLGISQDTEVPGFKYIILRPTPAPKGIMKYTRGYYGSMYGRIESGWRDKDGILHYNVTTPANTTVTLHLPDLSEDGIMESGTPASEAEGVKFVGFENGEAIYELVSGSYEFTVPWQTLFKDVFRVNLFQLESQDN